MYLCIYFFVIIIIIIIMVAVVQWPQIECFHQIYVVLEAWCQQDSSHIKNLSKDSTSIEKDSFLEFSNQYQWTLIFSLEL